MRAAPLYLSCGSMSTAADAQLMRTFNVWHQCLDWEAVVGRCVLSRSQVAVGILCIVKVLAISPQNGFQVAMLHHSSCRFRGLHLLHMSVFATSVVT